MAAIGCWGAQCVCARVRGQRDGLQPKSDRGSVLEAVAYYVQQLRLRVAVMAAATASAGLSTAGVVGFFWWKVPGVCVWQSQVVSLGFSRAARVGAVPL